MTNDLHRRWFEPPSIKAAVSYMLAKRQNVPAGQLDEVQNKRDKQAIKMGLIAGGASCELDTA